MSVIPAIKEAKVEGWQIQTSLTTQQDPVSKKWGEGGYGSVVQCPGFSPEYKLKLFF